MLIQALECVDDGDYSNALKLYDLVLKEEPGNTHALIDKGVTLQNMGKLKSAIQTAMIKCLSIHLNILMHY